VVLFSPLVALWINLFVELVLVVAVGSVGVVSNYLRQGAEEMTTMTEYWERVEDAAQDAHLAAWDTCHKIYLAMDEAEADWFRANYNSIVEGTPDELVAAVSKWYDESCFLRFVTAVKTNLVDPNAGYATLIPQGAEEDDEDEGEV
jgi:hypothetical protein